MILLINYIAYAHIFLADEVAEAYLWLMKDSNVTGFVASSNSGVMLV